MGLKLFDGLKFQRLLLLLLLPPATTTSRQPTSTNCFFLPLDKSNMSFPIAPSRALLKSQPALASAQCRRLFSSPSSAAAKRPVASFLKSHQPKHQPLVQKRFKYKSIAEAKSRYSTGVRPRKETRKRLRVVITNHNGTKVS